MGRELALRLLDMRAAIDDARGLLKGNSRKVLDKDGALHWACLNRISVVAEAAKSVPAGLRAKHPEINWKDLIGMGDMLRHQYFRVEADIVWGTVTVHFPVLWKAVKAMLEEIAAEA